MKSKHVRSLLAGLALCASLHTHAAPLGAAFTYQGRLNDRGAPANGSYDLLGTLYDAPSGGASWHQVVTNTAVGVTNGLFTTTIDFGPDAFNGTAWWLELAVRTNGSGAFVPLTPRQLLTPAPYALYAPTAGDAVTAYTANVANGVANNAVMAPGIAAGQVVKSLNGLNDTVTLAAGANVTLATNGHTLQISATGGGAAWSLTGNGSTTPGVNFLGTTDNRPLELKVNNQRALRLEPTTDSPNVVGGWSDNIVAPSVVGSVIGGGGTRDFDGAPAPNRVEADYSAIGGGMGNLIQAGGWANTISGGWTNAVRTATAEASIGGGILNSIGGWAHGAAIGGGFSNTIQQTAWYATIAGGVDNLIGTNSTRSSIGGGDGNLVGRVNFCSTVSGGTSNSILARAHWSAVGGGQYNTIQPDAEYATISGGTENTNGAPSATISGGRLNTIQANSLFATISGGRGNTVLSNADFATIPGGVDNAVGGESGFAAGQRARALHRSSFVWADSQSPFFESTAPDQFLVRAQGGVGIGTSNPQAPLHVAGAVRATVFQGDGSGLTGLSASSLGSGTVTGTLNFNPPGGAPFTVGNQTLVGNLNADFLDGWHSSHFWQMGGNSGVGAADFLGTTDNQPLELKVNNQRALRLEPTAGGEPNVIAGSANNSVGPGVAGATIGGGATNLILQCRHSTIGGGAHNSVRGGYGGGDYATIGGGIGNQTLAPDSTISGGEDNSIWSSAVWGTIGGGGGNRIWSNAHYSTVGGGHANTIQNNAARATIPGGESNVVAGSFGFAAGFRSQALHDGTFVWADATDSDFASTGPNEFSIRAAGGVRVESPLGLKLNAANQPLITRGYDPFTSGGYTGLGRWGLFMEPFNLVIGIPNVGGRNFQVAKYDPDGTRTALATIDQSGNLFIAGTYYPTSDREAKTNFAKVDSGEVLAQVAAMPIETWSYKTEGPVRHIGPVAQDFHAAFAVGADDKHIATIDADGVALAAIQGLNRKVDSATAALRAENAELKRRLSGLEKLVSELARSAVRRRDSRAAQP